MIVTCSPYSSCGDCSACDKGRFNACKYNQTLGVQRDGALTEYIAVPWRKLFYGPGLSAAHCALVEPLAVGFHAAIRANPQPTDTVVVIGTGVVGLGAIVGAVRMKARRVIAVDVSDSKLHLAREAGATISINSSAGNLHHSLMELTDGRGADVVIEAVGKVETFLAAVDQVCYAGRVVYVGYASQPVTYDTKQFLLKELSIQGSRGSTPKDMQSVIDILHDGAYPAQETITQTVSFDQTSSALRDWDANPGDFAKIQVQVSQESYI
jgi:threonine dehydrogenase-like Zn-dependent dehydrogenase